MTFWCNEQFLGGQIDESMQFESWFGLLMQIDINIMIISLTKYDAKRDMS